MKYLVTILVFIICIVLSTDAFSRTTCSLMRNRMSWSGSQGSTLSFRRYGGPVKTFGEVLDEVSSKYGRSVFNYDSSLSKAIADLRVSKVHAEKLREFQSRLRGEFSNRPGDMPTPIVDPVAKAIIYATKAVFYVGLYFVVEMALKKVLLWTNTDKRIKRATIVQQTQENLKAQAVRDLLLKLEMTTKLKDKQQFLKELSDLDPTGSIQKMLVESGEIEQQDL